MPIDALSVLCAQLTRDLLAIAKFLFLMTLSEPQHSSASNKCIGDDTKAAVRQSLNCIKNKKYGEKRFSIWRNCYTLQCGTIMTLISPGDCMRHAFLESVNSPSGNNMQCDTWLWDEMPLNSPKRPPYWNSTSAFNFDHITAVRKSYFET